MSECVCFPPRHLSSSASSLQPSPLFFSLLIVHIRLKHTHKHTHTQLHIHKVISCEPCLAMTLTSLQSLLGSFTGEVTSFCLQEYRVSYLFGCLHTSKTLIPFSLFLLSTHIFAHLFFFPISQPTPKYTHTTRWFSGVLCTDGYGSIALGKRITLSTFCWIADVMSIHSTVVAANGVELAAVMNR